ncbi:MAG: Ig domain-containing protein [Candidatus Nomurabacteria bacterium]|nr:Ig domain-containing protein [Candidatus Nomurabacteria bacterium]
MKNIYKKIILALIVIIVVTLSINKIANATGEPLVVTDPATEQTPTTMKVHGSVINTNLEHPYLWFEVSQSQTDLLSGLNPQAVYVNVVGLPSYSMIAPPVYSITLGNIFFNLTPNTIYYFRFCASNQYGTYCASPLSTATLVGNSGGGSGGSGGGNQNNAPVNISNVTTYAPAQSVTDTSAILHGSATVTGGGNSSGYFRYSKVTIPPISCNDIFGSEMVATREVSLADWVNGSDFYKSIPDTSFSSNSTANNLEPNTKYAYCAIVSNDAPNNTGRPPQIRYGGVQTFTTLPCPLNNPTCQSIIINTDDPFVVNSSSVNLNGSYNSNKAIKTWFEYKKDTDSSWISTPKNLNQAQSAGEYNANLSSLTASTLYNVRAAAEEYTNGVLVPPIYYGDVVNFQTAEPDGPGVIVGGPEDGATYIPVYNNDDGLVNDIGLDNGSGLDNNNGNGNDNGNGLGSDNGNGNAGGESSQCPTLTLANVPNQTVQTGSILSFSNYACGSNGQAVTYTATGLPAGATLSSSGIFSWNTGALPIPAINTYTFTINASAHAVSSTGATTTTIVYAAPITVTVDVVPVPPDCSTLRINSIESQTIFLGQTGIFNMSSCGANGQTVTYLPTNGLPSGAVLTPAGAFSWTPLASQINVYNVTISASTPTQDPVSITVHINVSQFNSSGGGGGGGQCTRLALSAIGIQTVQAGSSLAFSAYACGSNGETVTYRATNLPSGATFTPDGIFSWNTDEDQVDSYAIVISADTPSQYAAPVTVQIIVTEIPLDCPVLKINPIQTQNVTAGQNVAFYATVCGDNGEVVTYTMTDLPDGAGYSQQAGLFLWTPTTNQANSTGYNVKVNANTNTQDATEKIVHINVAPAMNGLGNNNGSTGGDNSSQCTTLTLANIPNQTVQAGSGLSFSAYACGSNGQAVTYTATGLPAGATLSSSGIFSWNTTTQQVGTYTFTIGASAHAVNSMGASTSTIIYATPITVTIDVTPIPLDCPILRINPIQNQSVVVGQTDVFNVTSCGSNGETVTYSATGLPTNATLTPAGYFSWTPVASQINIYNITINARTPNQDTVTTRVHISVTLPSVGIADNGTISGCVDTNGILTDCIITGGVNIDGTLTVTVNGITYVNTGGSNTNGVTTGGTTVIISVNGNRTGMLGTPGTIVPAIGAVAIPPIDDVVGYQEGIENVFYRQIVGNIPFAKLYGYRDGNDLNVFAGILSHTFAQMFGYVNGGGREIRVSIANIAAYRLGFKNGSLAVYEYYDNHLTGISTLTRNFKSAFDYEYYFKKK